MEMSVGTLVTIVLLMAVLGLGIYLISQIFGGATDSVDSINARVKSQIDNLFNVENQDIVVSLGAKHEGKIKQGAKNFGFVIGFAPEDPRVFGDTGEDCDYDITITEGDKYCIGSEGGGMNNDEVESWFITGIENVKFSDVQRGIGYDLIRLSVPDTTPTCIQRFKLLVECSGDGDYFGSTFFDLEIIKKGFL